MSGLRLHDRETEALPTTTVQLLWIPLGVGACVVRTSGRLFEAIAAAARRRSRLDLYHSALEVTGPDGRYAIEMAPVGDQYGERRGVVTEGAVGSKWLGRLRVFRYEIRRALHGSIADRDAAVGGPIAVSTDADVAQRIIDLVPAVPTPVWGRDELRTGEMWNSNSVTSWLLTIAGVDLDGLGQPPGGRAPGWDAGRLVAARSMARSGEPSRRGWLVSGGDRQRLRLGPVAENPGNSRGGQYGRL
jgi:hypothetical protein